jgi:hypothetical protein
VDDVDIILVDIDGNFSKLIPLFLERGITGFYPFEVQAGMDREKLNRMIEKFKMRGGG